MATPGYPEALVRQLMTGVTAGDLTAVGALLSEHPGLAAARLVDAKGGTLSSLHAVTNWPGYFPHGPEMARLLLDAGAEADARSGPGDQGETPLQWAASSDDADVAEVLIDGGADLNAPDGSIGTPLANAVGYGCWNVARLLVARGAPVDALWIAAALGLMPRLKELLAADPAADELNAAFWQACHGGQRRAAEHLLALGADIDTIPDYGQQTPLEIAVDVDTQRDLLQSWLRERGARPAG